MKIICCFAILIMCFFTISPASADDEVVKKREMKFKDNSVIKYEIETTIRSPMQTLGKNAFWGGATGLLLGLAGNLILNPKSNGDRYYEIPISLGILAGTGYGIYNLSSREDFYIDTSVKTSDRKNLTDSEKNNLNRAKEKKVYATIRKRLDSPIKHAFYDTLWGGFWGCLMSTAIIWLPEIENGDTQRSLFRYGMGGGILLGLSSSLIYNYVQKKRMHEIAYAPVQNNFLGFYNPSSSSWNLAFRITF